MKINYYSANDDVSKRWYVRITDYVDGKRKVWKTYEGLANLSSAQERHEYAQKLVAELEQAAKSGWHPAKNVETYQDKLVYHKDGQKEKVQLYDIRSLMNEYLKVICGPEFRKKTIEQRITKCRTFIEWCDSQKITQVSQIQQRQAEQYAQFLKSEKMHKAATFNLDILTLRGFFNFLKKSNPDIVNHFLDIPKMKNNSKPHFPFKAGLIPVMKDWMATNDPQLLLFCKFQYYCFIRPTELRFLKVEYIDIDDCRILLPAKITKNKKDQYVTIPDAFLRDIVKLKITKSPQDYYVFSIQGIPGEKPVSTNYFYKHHSSMQNELDISMKYTLYCWKPTGVWQAVKAGVDIKSLQTQLRHESLETTDKYLKGIGILDMAELQAKFPTM